MATFKNIFNPRAPKDGGFFLAIKELLGFNPKNIGIYQEAFTHRSTNTTSTQGHAQNYERMEFLGDAMLSSIIAAHLYNQVPGGDEGYLTKMRSKVVSREHLNELG
jgi:ribonuclease-3